ncbi:CPBP family intramembrane glutamic endopeptidase [Vagococcus vulneris]|uniref:CAAX prenyl protease 2/Lysostaphin resistance protein A-like domain-containing protein n=1 Tax=Vagococcus vulneris TaxID=1977869 RepID=A0A429ZZN7_9ENTE|nr:type II CAAX endopeptidase family protein [Vagococcus vulneris]RST99515.1 hypothetical protein CBF37_04100 [Vagococcus vulneris]
MKFWKVILNILILIGLFIVSQIPMTIVMIPSMMAQFKKTSSFGNMIVSIVFLIVFILCAWLFIWLYRKLSNDTSWSIDFKTVGIIIGTFLIGRIFVTFGTILMEKIYGVSTTANDTAIQSLFGKDSSSTIVILLSISIAIGAPLFEEIMFRGLPKAMFGSVVPNWLLWLLTSLAFASVHLSENIISFFMYFILGLLMYYVFQRRGKIVDSMLFHFLNNIFPTIALLLVYFDVINLPM